MGCCLASAKANLKAETSIFKKAEFEIIIKSIESMIDVVGAAEAADVQPVKRGTWENTNTPNQLRCSNCEITHFIAQYPHGDINYCPNCGADMRGDTNG